MALSSRGLLGVASGGAAGRRRQGFARGSAAAVPEGHVPVHVGEGSDGEAERFLVRDETLGHAA